MRMSTSTSNNTLKILCLHGYTSNGTIHAYQSRKITSLLSSPPSASPSSTTTTTTSSSPSSTTQYTFIFPSGPHLVQASRIEDKLWHDYVTKHSTTGHHAWWFAREAATPPITEGSFVDPNTGGYYGLEESLRFVADVIEKEGPIHAVWGFSQGACLAGMLVALLASSPPSSSISSGSSSSSLSSSSSPSSTATKTITLTDPLARQLRALLPADQPPVPGIFFSGFKARFERYAGIYDRRGVGEGEKEWPPTLHVMGKNDSDVRVERSRALVEACGEETAEVLCHGNGHNLPKEEEEIERVVDWVKRWVKP